MKRRMISLLLCIAMLLLVFAGCGESAPEIKISGQKEEITVGESFDITVDVVNPPKSGYELVSISSNTSVATISGETVQSLAEGTTTIFVRFKDDSTVFGSFTLKVKSPYEDTQTASDLLSKYDSVSGIKIAGNYSVVGKILYVNGKNAILDDGTGLILIYSNVTSSLEVGKNYIVSGPVVLYGNGFEFADRSTNVTAKEFTEELKIPERTAISVSAAMLKKNAMSDHFTCEYVEYKGRFFKNGNYTNIDVGDFVVVGSPSGKSFGSFMNQECVIRGYICYANGADARYVGTLVTDVIAIKNTSMQRASALFLSGKQSIGVNETSKIYASYNTVNLSGENFITWESSDSCVTVDDFGNIRGVSEGTATITATMDTYKATFPVTVNKFEGSIAARKVFSAFNRITLDVGQTADIAPQVLPVNATADITYSVADESIAKVEGNTLTALGYGRTKVTLSIPSGYEYSFDVIVDKYTVTGYKEGVATKYCDLTDENNYLSITDASRFLLEKENAAYKRSADFDDFKINSQNLGTRVVTNSDELVECLADGYLPVFKQSNLKAEGLYLKAKAILREIITDNMTDFEKLLAIYDYVSENVMYDNDGLKAQQYMRKYYCMNYLEGALEEGRAVCEGKAKALAVLCAIEGLEVKLPSGRLMDGSDGHAWNYVKINGSWYTVCATYGSIHRSSKTDDFAKLVGYNLITVEYNSFGAPLDYMSQYSLYRDNCGVDVTGPRKYVSTAEIFSAKKFGDGQYDLAIDSAEELTAIFGLIKESGLTGDYFLNICNRQASVTEDMIRGALTANVMSVSYYHYTYSRYGVVCHTILIHQN